jgi:hypothetical protein
VRAAEAVHEDDRRPALAGHDMMDECHWLPRMREGGSRMNLRRSWRSDKLRPWAAREQRQSAEAAKSAPERDPMGYTKTRSLMFIRTALTRNQNFDGMSERGGGSAVYRGGPVWRCVPKSLSEKSCLNFIESAAW